MADKLVFAPVRFGKQVIEGISLETGRSGHMLGSVWYLFDIAGKKILYTGDMCKEPSVLAFDTPPKCDADREAALLTDGSAVHITPDGIRYKGSSERNQCSGLNFTVSEKSKRVVVR